MTRADRLRREVTNLESLLGLIAGEGPRRALRERLDAKLDELDAAEDEERADDDDERTRAADAAEDAELERDGGGA